jgi:hypothetical protein
MMRDTGGISIPQRAANSVFLLADLSSLQRTPNCGYSEALSLSLLGTWNRQHGTVLHSDQRVFVPKRTAVLWSEMLKQVQMHERRGILDEEPRTWTRSVVSSPGGFHPQALSEPDLNLSIHPAPIIQPYRISPLSSVQIDEAPCEGELLAIYSLL